MNRFTKRELQICRYILKGWDIPYIALQTGLPNKQVSFHKRSIRDKLDLDANQSDFILVKELYAYFSSLGPEQKVLLLVDYKIDVFHSLI